MLFKETASLAIVVPLESPLAKIGARRELMATAARNSKRDTKGELREPRKKAGHPDSSIHARGKATARTAFSYAESRIDHEFAGYDRVFKLVLRGEPRLKSKRKK